MLALRGPGPEPLINIIVHPPPEVILPHNAPVYLPCVANYTGELKAFALSLHCNERNFNKKNIIIFSIDSGKIDTFSEDDEIEHDDNNETDEEEHTDLQPSKANRMRDTHFTDLVPNDKVEQKSPNIRDQLPNNDDDHDNDDEGITLFKRDVQNEFQRYYKIRYFWYRNDELLDPKREHGFQIFQNGTLKINHSLRATGIFRCKAKGWRKEIGAIISRACHVRQAGE